MSSGPDHPKTTWAIPMPSMSDLGRFVVFSGITLLGVVLAETGRGAYTLLMLIIAAALVYAALDLVDYEIVKRKKGG